MSALAACTSPSGHALHTKGWGSILLLHVFRSRYQGLVLACVSPVCEAAKSIQQLTGHLPQTSRPAPEQGGGISPPRDFLHLGCFSVQGSRQDLARIPAKLRRISRRKYTQR